MSSHIEFNTSGRLPAEGSRIAYGTAELRAGDGTIEGGTLIALGSVESCSIKDTGDEEELVGENGETETELMMDEGQEVSLGVRFTRNVAAPRKGWFIALKVPYSVLTPAAESPATAETNDSLPQSFLITNVTLDYGNKAVRKYSLTCRRWDNIPGGCVGRVITASGALVNRFIAPVPIDPE